ncbi:hypothetical protein Tco_1432618 [Tanacetum coccineum]
MVVKSEILYDLSRFFNILIAKLTAGGVVNFTLKMKRDMVIGNLDLEPKINAMMREFLECHFEVQKSFPVERIEQGNE